MTRYIEAIEQLPSEIKLPLVKVLELFKEEIAETVKRSDFEELKAVVRELAEAQKRTEDEIKALIRSHRELRSEVGGLSHTIGYRLEDESYKALPALLKKDLGIEVKGRLKRDFIEIGRDRYIEVNIWGEARYNGKECVIVGEARSQLKKKDIDGFIKRADELKRYIPKEQVRILVTYHTSPQVQRYARENDIKVYFSYEF